MTTQPPIDNYGAAARFSVAPMMAWTDRHCRYFHRLMTRHTLLYTEMVTAAAIMHGDAARFLNHGAAEYPLALQIGGADPAQLAHATRLAADAGFREVNLNIGCPSDRVQSGTFGAVLMKSPSLVADCARAMLDAAGGIDITIKCRIGVDDQQPEQILPQFIEMVQNAGITRMTIHARMAWLSGLSPKENRDIPPLNYPLVHDMKRQFSDMHISINGGITAVGDAQIHLDAGLDGVMVGRAAYHQPYDMLATVDREIYNDENAQAAQKTRLQIAHDMGGYIGQHLSSGGRVHQVTRHMMGLFSGQSGARHWRRALSELGANHAASRGDYEKILDEVEHIQTAQTLNEAAAV